MDGKAHRPRKRFGQNFLHDQSVIQRIVNAINPSQDQQLVEIGPGQGALTKALYPSCKNLTAVEIDRDLAARLTKDPELHGLALINQDFLDLDLAQAITGSPIRLVGNLPYNVSTPILFRAVQQLELIQDMHFMLQKEVVERMGAEPGSKTYGRLSVMLQYHCVVQPLFVVKPGAFFPAPKVDSMIVRMIPKPPEQRLTANPEALDQVVKLAFSQRRKTLSNALKTILTAKQIEQIGIDPKLRAEALSVADFVALSNGFSDLESDLP